MRQGGSLISAPITPTIKIKPNGIVKAHNLILITTPSKTKTLHSSSPKLSSSLKLFIKTSKCLTMRTSEKSQGQRSLAGYSPWGCKESGTTE